jgi:hypothetical protein
MCQSSPLTFSQKSLSGWFWPDSDRQDRMDKLVEMGCIVAVEDGYQLAGWQAWAAKP